METFDEVRDVIQALEDVYMEDDLHWSVHDGQVHAMINCNDQFGWATADGENIEADDIPKLRQAFGDLEALPDRSAKFHTDLLFVARKRSERPQNAIYESIPQCAWHLFDACGPTRAIDWGNPKPRPPRTYEDTQ